MMELRNRNIGAHLQLLRLERGINQRELAKLLHTTQSGISQIERDCRDVGFSTIMRYCEAIGARIHIGLPEETA